MSEARAIDRREFERSAGVLGLLGGIFAVRPAEAATAERTLASLSITEACGRIRDSRTTASALVDACLERIDLYEPKLNAFITVLNDQARQEADILDREQKAGKLRGVLHGIPIALKDNIDTKDERTTAGSQVYIGLSICGPRFGEGRILALAHAYEQATSWRNCKPLLSPATTVPPIPHL